MNSLLSFIIFPLTAFISRTSFVQVLTINKLFNRKFDSNYVWAIVFKNSFPIAFEINMIMKNYNNVLFKVSLKTLILKINSYILPNLSILPNSSILPTAGEYYELVKVSGSAIFKTVPLENEHNQRRIEYKEMLQTCVDFIELSDMYIAQKDTHSSNHSLNMVITLIDCLICENDFEFLKEKCNEIEKVEKNRVIENLIDFCIRVYEEFDVPFNQDFNHCMSYFYLRCNNKEKYIDMLTRGYEQHSVSFTRELMNEYASTNFDYSCKISNDAFKFILNDTDKASICNCLGNIYYKIRRDYNLALDNYNLAIELDKKCADYWVNKAILFQQMKKFNQAIFIYESYLKQLENQQLENQQLESEQLERFNNDHFSIKSDIYNRIGEVYRKLNKWTEALDYFMKALQYNLWNNNVDVNNKINFNIAFTLEHLNRCQEALCIYESLLEAKQNEKILVGLYRCHFELCHYEKCIEIVKQILQLKDSLKWYIAILDCCWLSNNIINDFQFEEYLVLLENKKQTESNEIECTFYRGIFLFTQGHFEESITCFTNIIESNINPNDYDASAYRRIGEAYENLHNFEEAMNQYQKAILIDSAGGNSHYNIAKLYMNTTYQSFIQSNAHNITLFKFSNLSNLLNLL